MSITPFDPTFEGFPNPNDDLGLEDTQIAEPDYTADSQVIAEETFNAISDRVPGWTAHDGNLDVWLVEAFSLVAAEIRTLAANVPDAIFATFGQEVLGIPVQPSAPATGTSTWTATDAQGYAIPAGTQFTLARTGDDLVAFEVFDATEIPVGQTSVDNVLFRAVDDGTHANGLTGAGEVIDPLAWVEEINVPGVTSGGFDGQTVDEYLNGGAPGSVGLVSLLRMIALRPILPLDFAVLALNRSGEVGRAIAMDLYDPATQTWGHERTITLILTGPDGLPVPAQVKADVQTYLEGLREVNFVINIIDANYQSIDVTAQVTAFAEQNPDVVQTACVEQLTSALSPAGYRLGTTSPSIMSGEVIPPPPAGGQPGRRFVRRNDLIGLLDRTRGVDWVIDVQINGGQADVELGSPTTLPQPGTITVTVTEQ